MHIVIAGIGRLLLVHKTVGKILKQPLKGQGSKTRQRNTLDKRCSSFLPEIWTQVHAIYRTD